MKTQKEHRRLAAPSPADIMASERARASSAGLVPWTSTRSGEEALVRPVIGRVISSSGAVGEGVTTWLITTDQVDRMNDRIDPRGAAIKRFAENPVILWGHESWAPPIGRAASLPRAVALSDGRTGLEMNLEFHKLTDLSIEVSALVDAKYINAGSIGFIPLSFYEEGRDRYEDAYDYLPTVRTFDRWELLEFSICSVPMNPGALIQRDVSSLVRGAVERDLIPADGALAGWAMRVTRDQLVTRVGDTGNAGSTLELVTDPTMTRADPTVAPTEPDDASTETPDAPMDEVPTVRTEETYLNDTIAYLQQVVAESQLVPALWPGGETEAFAAEAVAQCTALIGQAVAALAALAIVEETGEGDGAATPEGDGSTPAPLPGSAGAAMTSVPGSEHAPLVHTKVGRKISKKNREHIYTAYAAIAALKEAADDGVIDDDEAEDIAAAAAGDTATYGGTIELSAILTTRSNGIDMTISQLVSLVSEGVAQGKTHEAICTDIAETIAVTTDLESEAKTVVVETEEEAEVMIEEAPTIEEVELEATPTVVTDESIVRTWFPDLLPNGDAG